MCCTGACPSCPSSRIHANLFFFWYFNEGKKVKGKKTMTAQIKRFSLISSLALENVCIRNTLTLYSLARRSAELACQRALSERVPVRSDAQYSTRRSRFYCFSKAIAHPATRCLYFSSLHTDCTETLLAIFRQDAVILLPGGNRIRLCTKRCLIPHALITCPVETSRGMPR